MSHTPRSSQQEACSCRVFSLPFIWVRIEPTCGWLDNTQGECGVTNLSKVTHI